MEMLANNARMAAYMSLRSIQLRVFRNAQNAMFCVISINAAILAAIGCIGKW